MKLLNFRIDGTCLASGYHSFALHDQFTLLNYHYYTQQRRLEIVMQGLVGWPTTEVNHWLNEANQFAATQTKPAYAGYILVHAGGLRLRSAWFPTTAPVAPPTIANHHLPQLRKNTIQNRLQPRIP